MPSCESNFRKVISGVVFFALLALITFEVMSFKGIGALPSRRYLSFISSLPSWASSSRDHKESTNPQVLKTDRVYRSIHFLKHRDRREAVSHQVRRIYYWGICLYYRHKSNTVKQTFSILPEITLLFSIPYYRFSCIENPKKYAWQGTHVYKNVFYGRVASNNRRQRLNFKTHCCVSPALSNVEVASRRQINLTLYSATRSFETACCVIGKIITCYRLHPRAG